MKAETLNPSAYRICPAYSIPEIRSTDRHDLHHEWEWSESAIHEGEHLPVVTLERVNPRRNAYQYYVLSIELTLFEEVSLVREWGRVGQRGRPIVELCPDAAAARIEMEAWLRRKRRRGYEARL